MNDIDCYFNLAVAIVERAIFDYRKALRRLKLDTEDVFAGDEAASCEQFFMSDWFKILTNLDGKFVIDSICEQELFV